jgi:hypothetical protein
MSDFENTNLINFNYDNQDKNDNNQDKNNNKVSESSLKLLLNKYSKEINIILFIIIVYIISNYIFDIYYPQIDDNLFITKIVNSFRYFLKKYQIMWFIVLLIGLLLLNDIQNRNMNYLTKNTLIILIFCFILFFPFYPFTTYYNLYISLVHNNIKSIDTIISNKFKK